jgi:hypothetical protein
LIRPDEATWRSGYATVCKTVYTSSILVVASINIIKWLDNIVENLILTLFFDGDPKGTHCSGMRSKSARQFAVSR